MSALEELGAFVVKNGIGAPVADLVRRHAIDVIGAWIAASSTNEGQALRAFPLGAANIDAMATHCALARLSEIDDIDLASLTTPGATVVPAALTLGAGGAHASPEDLTDAITAGYEAMIRLGLAIGGATLPSRGIWASYFAAPFGVAAVAARLHRLSAAQATHALALALYAGSPNAGHQHGPMTSRWFAFGMKAREGALAALAAKAGFLSDPDLLESSFLSDAFRITPTPEVLSEGLGSRYALAHLSFKPWCAARQTMAGTQALREMLAQGLKPEEITTAEVFIPPMHVRMVDHGVAPDDRTAHLTSLPYQMALAAFAPDDALDVRQAPGTIPEPMRIFLEKVQVAGDESFTSLYPACWPARLRVATKSEVREHRVDAISGDPKRPFDDAAVAEKFRGVVGRVLDEEGTNLALEQASRVLTADGVVNHLLTTIMFAGRIDTGEPP